MRGKVFKLDQGNFRRVFYDRARDAGILRETLREDGKKEIFPQSSYLAPYKGNGIAGRRRTRHCRSGFARTFQPFDSLLITAEYLRLSGQDIKGILQAKGMI